MSDKCMYCQTLLTKRDFNCPKCGNGFCKIHVGTNEKYTCAKCGASHTRETALKFNNRCPSVPQSSCPKCSTNLRLDLLPAGQKYLACDKCGWNSFEQQPMICYQSESIVLREGQKLGLVKKPKQCDFKLKRSNGREFCPNCLINFLKSSSSVSFSTIAKLIEINEEDVPMLVKSLTKDYKLTGVIDEQNKLYTFVDPSFKNRINEQIKGDGYIAIDGLANHLGIEKDQALKLMYEIIRSERIRGTFSKEKKFYYTSSHLQEKLVELAKEAGQLTLEELVTKFNVHPDIIKDYLVTLLKTKKIDGFFAAKGSKIYTKVKLQDLIMDFSLEQRSFKLEEVAQKFNIAIELVRSTLHELVKQGRLRGVFTQKREYVTDVALKEQIIKIVMAYRTMSLSDLAKKLSITERTVEESLASLIARGELSGYIDLKTREFVYEAVAPGSTQVPPGQVISTVNQDTVSEQPSLQHDEKFIEVVREYDFIGGQVHFKIAIRNNSPVAIYDVKVVLDYPDAFQLEEEMITVPVIEPDSSRGIDFYLEPTSCGKSQVSATVIYKDFTSTVHTIHARKKEVWIKCPLVVSTMDTLDDVLKVIQSLPSDGRSFLISDIDTRLAYHAGFRAISHFDARCVAAPEKGDDENFEADAYFATKAKMGGRIVIQMSVSEKTQIMEIRVWCAEPGQLTGLLAKIIEYLFQEINTIRNIKADSREKTIDLMAIAQGITVLSDYVMLKWKYGDIANKLEDIYARLMKFLKSDEVLDEMKDWLDIVRASDEETHISQEDADGLGIAVEKWQDVINRAVAPA
ncbi:MAG: PCI domain-containing protein [Candidatus Hodarchaeota archaeon]